MLELTRRMTVKRSSMTRIAGAYMDREGYVDGTFNTNFLKLSPADKEKNLALAKAVPFSETNVNLKRYQFPKEQMTAGTMWQLLNGIKNSGLKNDALMDTFYEIAGEEYRSYGDYAVYMFHDRYDIPVKAADHERVGESEEVYESASSPRSAATTSRDSRSAGSCTRRFATEAATGIMWIFIRRIRNGRTMS